MFTNFQGDNYGTSSGDDEENCTIKKLEMLICVNMVGRAEVVHMKTMETGRRGGTCLNVGVKT